MRTLTIPAETDQLETVQAFIDEDLDAADCAPETRIQLQIAVEELFVNIALYAYEPGHGDAVIGCLLERNPLRVTIRFQDRGKPFNPLAKKDADITLSAEERGIGGLGIYMVKNTMDAVHYVWENGCNILTVQKNL
ncbi:MAG: ATP-binding protein [Oscillibacter sp.]|nr:ATP-binding protein [Oscillibacter sp.]